MARQMLLVTLIITICLSFSTSIFGNAESNVFDGTTCLLKGTVLDQKGAAVTAARVDAVMAGSIKTSTSTDGIGSFSLSLVQGEYMLSVHAEGFMLLQTRVTACQSVNEIIELKLEVQPASAVVDVVEDSAYLFGTISSATKTYTALRDIPQSISLTTKQQVIDQNMTSIGEVVRYQPGITAHQGENNRDQVIIRGQSSSADFFVNGVRDDVQYYRDLYNLDRVEILRGPNALVFGRGGGGGVVNRVIKEADFTPAYRFSLQGGSFGDTRGTFDVNKPLTKELAVRFNGVAEYRGSFRRAVSLRRFGFSPTLTYAPDSKTNINASFEIFSDVRTADRGITSFQNRPADVSIETFYGNPADSRVNANVKVFSASLDRTFGKLMVHNRTLFGDYDRFYQNYVPGVVNASGTLVTLTAYNNSTRRRNLFSQTDLTYQVSTSGLKHTLLGGFEYGRQRTDGFRQTGFFNNTSSSIQVAFDDPTTTIPVTFRQSATDADNRVRTNIAAGYFQDQIEVNRYLQFVTGARFDYFDLKFHNNRSAADLRRIDRLVAPRFGIVIKPIIEISLYGSYSVSYLPSSGDQFSSLTNITEQMKPERFTNYELGAKWDVRPGFQFTAAAYRLDRTNTRSIDPNDPTRIIQTGAQRTNGIEFAINGSVTRKWLITGGYAYQDAFIARATASAGEGKQVPQVPHHNFSVWNKYQLLRRLSAGLGIIRRTDMFAGVDNTIVLPGYTRADGAVYYDLNERWRLQANVENLFDTRYHLNADSNTNITPGSPRAFKLSVNARF